MQLKLELFEESLDKYRRGKGFNQKLLQTGEPIGTFKVRDPHPWVEGLFYREYRKDTKDRINERDRTRYKNDENLRRKKRAGAARYYRTDAGRLANIKAKSRYNKSEKGKESHKRYRETEKGQRTSRHCHARRRAKVKKASIGLTREQEDEIQQIYLHAVRVTNKLQIAFEVDHIVPVSKGGKHEPLNLQVVPRAWNRSKGNKHTEIWQGL
jgi:hypothetical protein